MSRRRAARPSASRTRLTIGASSLSRLCACALGPIPPLPSVGRCASACDATSVEDAAVWMEVWLGAGAMDGAGGSGVEVGERGKKAGR